MIECRTDHRGRTYPIGRLPSRITTLDVVLRVLGWGIPAGIVVFGLLWFAAIKIGEAKAHDEPTVNQEWIEAQIAVAIDHTGQWYAVGWGGPNGITNAAGVEREVLKHLRPGAKVIWWLPRLYAPAPPVPADGGH